MESLNIVLAGGGTAGHVNPLLATARELRELGAHVVCVGTREGLEADLVPGAGFELRTIERVPFPRRPGVDMLTFPSRYAKAVAQAGTILDDAGAQVAVGFGGFASTPIYAAARRRSVPVVIHEQNAKPGLANRYGATFAAAVGLTFTSTPLQARKGVTRAVGLPLREPIAKLAGARVRDAGAARSQAAARLGLDPAKTTLVVTGGSLGAQHLNEVMTSSLDALAGIQVLHLTGRGKDDEVRRLTQSLPDYHVLDYLVTMEDAYAVADLVVARSGAGTVAELSALGLPAFFVPLPIGNGEQELNASDVLRVGGARLVRDRDFSPATVREEIVPLLRSSELVSMGEAARSVGPIDGATKLAHLVREVARA
ncbi:UDP-N-acetylglucosamine--N-acetylmuramyl-(pentapeptide) pyrophosphoryl-undecaprenol N-acetylglucosamine transferase [Arcanobacterium haemolyticum]|nr:UDP-N-acetylglucosamine--N-acetylmuramyl-(pentapeptide) pyrophosphoryl-undecaprenol N-acetylglucosamine transferase [Arcanobacterium haemolyticum]